MACIRDQPRALQSEKKSDVRIMQWSCDCRQSDRRLPGRDLHNGKHNVRAKLVTRAVYDAFDDFVTVSVDLPCPTLPRSTRIPFLLFGVLASPAFFASVLATLCVFFSAV